MKRYAHVENGVVTNVSNWDGETPFDPGPAITMVLTDGEYNAQIGATYDGTFHYVEPDPGPDTRSYDEKRKEAYNAAGCTIEALTIATFESVFADDSAAAVQLQIEREKIKAAIPKT